MNVSEAITTCEVMPHPQFEDLWDSIVSPPEVKQRLLRSTALSLRLRTVLPFSTTALHGLVVLHGGPGTGKSTLARGLASKIAPMMARKRCRFIEVNPHGLMSAEHGQSQQKVTSLLTEEIPLRADDGEPTIVLLDEVESMAVARSEASLSANPADVHRATDAVLTALDRCAHESPHIVYVATSNFTTALDAAFLSRADVAIAVEPPNAAGATQIVRKTLLGMAVAFPPLSRLADHEEIQKVGQALAGQDGRRIRKLVTEALLLRQETVLDPGLLTIEDLIHCTAENHVIDITVNNGRSHATA